MNKEKLQEQIQTMRTELSKMETELAESEKIELNGGGTYLFTDCFGIRFVKDNSESATVMSGSTRATRELAEIASKNMVARNKLEAYAHQIDPEYRDLGETHTVGVEYGKYIVCSYSKEYRPLCVVPMSQSTAEQICEWLNDGRIEL